MKRVLVLLLALFLLAFVKPLSVNLEEQPPAGRWSVDSKPDQKKALKKTKDVLAKAGIAESLLQWDDCIQNSRKVPKNSPVKDWAMLLELRCARKQIEEALEAKSLPKLSPTTLKESLTRAEKTEWRGAQLEEKSRGEILQDRLLLCQWLQKTSRWKELRVEVQRLFKNEYSLTKEDRAKLYFLAGELLVAERQWVDAYWQFSRAQAIQPDPSVDARVKAILPLLPSGLRAQVEERLKQSQEPPVPQPVMSVEEGDLYNQAQGYLGRGDPVGAVEAMSRLIKKFPVGAKAKWAQDKIYDLLNTEIQKSRGPQGPSVAKKKIESLMQDFDSDRLLEWGKNLFDQQAYLEAGGLLRKAAEELKSSPRGAKAYFLAARAFQLGGKTSEAKSLYQVLLNNYSAAPEVIDGGIQWGLINFNESEFSEAITHLEMARARKLANQQDLISLYWLYQSYKAKGTEPGVESTSRDLVQRFPLTYYGLMAFYDQKHELPKFEKTKEKKGKTAFSQNELNAFERAKVLLSSGLLNEAGEELNIIQTRPLSTEESQYLSNFFAQALQYQKSFALLSKVTDDDPTRRNDYLVHQLFPKEFYNLVNDDKKRSGLDPLLLLSVMKQESAFDHSAVSRSGAIGLLQMIPPTAQEVKLELNAGKVEIPDDLYDPETNVRFCAYYLSHLIKKYDGSIPLALAAYNAGPTRITQFVMSNGGALKDTWVDELPWAETSFYVKSILKNYVMYRMLYAGLTQLPSPTWGTIQTSSSGKR